MDYATQANMCTTLLVLHTQPLDNSSKQSEFTEMDILPEDFIHNL